MKSYLLLETMKKAAILVAAALVRLLSLLSPLRPLSSPPLVSQFLRRTSWESNGYADSLFFFFCFLQNGSAGFLSFCFFLWLRLVSSDFEMKENSQWRCRLSTIFSPVSFFFCGDKDKSSANLRFSSTLLSLSLCNFFFLIDALWFALIVYSLFGSVFWFNFSPLVLGFLLPFIEKLALQPVLSLQDCVMESTTEIMGKRRGPRSDLLQIICSPAKSGAPLLNRDRKDARLFLSNGAVLAEKREFSIWPLNFGNSAIGPLSN